MLKEARIVMPYHTMMTMNGSEVWSTKSLEAHRELKRQLCDVFGGFTMTLGHGGWVDETGGVVKDDVAIYDVAINAHRDQHWDTLYDIAMQCGRALDQKAVYIRYPDMSVMIEDVRPVLSEPDEKADRLLDALVTDSATEAAISEAMQAAVDGGIGIIFHVPFTEAGAYEAAAENHRHAALGTKHLPMPGETWETVAGAKVWIGRKATVIDGGWYVTVIDPGPTHERHMNEYVVNLDGKLQPALPGHVSPRDLKRRIH